MEKAEIERILIEKQVKPTAMRILVLEFLIDQEFAVSINDIEKGLENSDRITIFRTLKTFEKKGIIHSIEDSLITKYAICEESCVEENHNDLHVHATCIVCNQTFCLSKVKIPVINFPPNIEVKELSLIAKVICENCR